MAIIKASKGKRSLRELIDVDFDTGDAPVFPHLCPCCLDSTTHKSTIEVASAYTPKLRVAACRKCASHVTVFHKASRLMAWTVMVLTVATLLVYLTVTGGPLGWTMPFRSAVAAAATLLGALLVGIVWLFAAYPFMWLLDKFTTKKKCAGGNPINYERVILDSGKVVHRYTCFNLTYGHLFAKANGWPPPSANTQKSTDS